MSMFPLAMMAGGQALGAVGSILGAQSANRSARRAQDVSRSDAAAHQRMLGSLMFGPQGYQDLMLANHDRSGIRWAGLGDPNYRDPTQAQYQAGASRFFSQNPTLQDALKSSGQQYLGSLGQNLGIEQQRTRKLDSLARQAEGFGSDLQGQQEAQINRNSARDLKNLNQQTQAQLGWMGPSTLAANQMSGNQRQIGNQRDDALLAAAKAATDRLLAARGSRLDQLGQRYGLEGNLRNNLASETRNVALAPSQAIQSMLQGSAFQPMQANASAYSPYSPLGNAFASLGPALSQGGMFALLAGQGGGGNGSVPFMSGGGNGDGPSWQQALQYGLGG